MANYCWQPPVVKSQRVHARGAQSYNLYCCLVGRHTSRAQISVDEGPMCRWCDEEEETQVDLVLKVHQENKEKEGCKE